MEKGAGRRCVWECLWCVKDGGGRLRLFFCGNSHRVRVVVKLRGAFLPLSPAGAQRAEPLCSALPSKLKVSKTGGLTPAHGSFSG